MSLSTLPSLSTWTSRCSRRLTGLVQRRHASVRARRPADGQRGFTLIEVLVALAIVAIILIVFLVLLPLMFAIGLGLEGRLFPFEFSQPLVALAAFAEPRYLHQTMARTADGRDLCLLPGLANRHGLITGATGTGVTDDRPAIIAAMGALVIVSTGSSALTSIAAVAARTAGPVPIDRRIADSTGR